MGQKITPFPNGSMHGAEIGMFVCSAGKERTLHQVTAHTVIIASDSLATVSGVEREDRAMQTINFQLPEHLGGMRVLRRCRDCTLAAWQSCYLPKKERRVKKRRHVPKHAETMFG